MNADNTDLNALSEKVLGAVFEVSNTLGAGFLEKVYQRALLRELSLRGIRATAEASLAVTDKGHAAGGLQGLARLCQRRRVRRVAILRRDQQRQRVGHDPHLGRQVPRELAVDLH